MNEIDYNARLYEKMKAEQDKYRDWLLHQEPPEILNHTYEYTMRDDILICMEAQKIALAIELFTNGSLNTFAKRTNVDTDNRLICYDILDLGKQLMPIGILVVLDSILNRITQNRAKGKNTFIFIDEIYLLCVDRLEHFRYDFDLGFRHNRENVAVEMHRAALVFGVRKHLAHGLQHPHALAQQQRHPGGYAPFQNGQPPRVLFCGRHREPL